MLAELILLNADSKKATLPDQVMCQPNIILRIQIIKQPFLLVTSIYQKIKARLQMTGIVVKA